MDKQHCKVANLFTVTSKTCRLTFHLCRRKSSNNMKIYVCPIVSTGLLADDGPLNTIVLHPHPVHASPGCVTPCHRYMSTHIGVSKYSN